jgi:peptidoglycan/xylan/chitin deacetylase (PgdA/CDA1 family)
MMRMHNKIMHTHNIMMRAHNKIVQLHNKGYVRDWIKLGLATAFERSGLHAGYRALRTYAAGARIHVLGYHRVVDAIDWDAPVNPSLCITSAAFRRQMEQLREHFLVLPLSYVVRALAGEIELPQDAVAVTFDDGYRDVIMRAHPILRELEIPATVFVPTGFAAAAGLERFLPHDRLYAALWTLRQRRLSLPRVLEDDHPTRSDFEVLSSPTHRAAAAPPDLPPANLVVLDDADDGSARHAAAGNAPTPELLAEVDRILAAAGPAAAVDAIIHAIPAATLAGVIATLEARLSSAPLDRDAAVLSPAEVRTLADAGWEIGAHTIGHVVLTHEPLAEVRRQLVGSKQDLEQWSGRPCRYFAYCNGMHGATLVDELRRAGYEAAVTTWDRPNVAGTSDVFHIARKVLWEGHTRGPHGGFSSALSAAHLHDLFGLLRLTAPRDGTVAPQEMMHSHNTIVQSHNKPQGEDEDVVQTHNNLDPREVKLAY